MQAATPSSDDRLAARATAVGIGLIALMVGWLVANRITALVWDAPVGPVIAITFAVVAGVAAGIIGYRRLDASQV